MNDLTRSNCAGLATLPEEGNIDSGPDIPAPRTVIGPLPRERMSNSMR
jgi:hypothetical protein